MATDSTTTTGSIPAITSGGTIAANAANSSTDSSSRATLAIHRLNSGPRSISDSKNSVRSRDKGKDRPICEHCRTLGFSGLGHTIDHCYRLHGYPPGHPKHDNGNKGILGAKPSSHAVNKEAPVPVNPTFTPTQYAQILAMLNEGTSHSFADVIA
ncbi:hypothetical protein Dimus_031245, partial [Dionaea muscipula]